MQSLKHVGESEKYEPEACLKKLWKWRRIFKNDVIKYIEIVMAEENLDDNLFQMILFWMAKGKFSKQQFNIYLRLGLRANRGATGKLIS